MLGDAVQHTNYRSQNPFGKIGVGKIFPNSQKGFGKGFNSSTTAQINTFPKLNGVVKRGELEVVRASMNFPKTLLGRGLTRLGRIKGRLW